MLGDEPRICFMYEKMGKLLSSLLCKFIKNAHVYKSSAETLELKPIEELVKLDANKKEHVKSKINIRAKAKSVFHRILQITRILQMNFSDKIWFSVHQFSVTEINTNDNGFNRFFKIYGEELHRYTLQKKKYIRGNQSPFMNKTLSKEIMKITKLRNNFLKSRTEEIRKNTPSKETLVYHY